ncbi:preprotein translocase subunit Sec66 domain containing protein [Nitzschia inconspicua]|uniref:Preprotein translocase subunit Sec66 domain containing protein n=1 Tax=Nitzschia inconspicua TaxID=303405 RepID=A0A9K3L762_9STRA|nr:preprotein translocase subunit Sec66 domain containing protein [Nitzschia inconspicua]
MAEETVNINPDGSTTFEGGAGAGTGGEESTMPPVADTPGMDEETIQQVVKGTDPAIYLLLAVVLIGFLYFLYTRKARADAEDEFFASLEEEKFNLQLPEEVDEYYTVKEKLIKAGWKPGTVPESKEAAQNGPHRVIASALMKRAMADIPLVTHIQKESAGMNKLYSQSMCSVSQWRSYQAAEAMVSSEVDEVRAEADEIEPGWSQHIWRQAMQYHTMMKQKHELEQKQAAEQAAKRREIEQRVNEAKMKQMSSEDKEAAAERAAQELLQAEERERESKKAFSSGGATAIKKGFLDSKKKKK